MPLSIQTVRITPFQDQKPGTSGLRKKVKVFKQQHYTEAFVQSIFSAIQPNSVLVVGGDGRFFNKTAIHIIVSIAAANQVSKLIIGQKGIFSTPGPAPEQVTNHIYEISKTLSEYKICDVQGLDLDSIGTAHYGSLEVEIVDSIRDYVAMVKEIFDFDFIKSYLKANPSFKFLFDGMHAVTGPYAQRIFLDELGMPPTSIVNCIPKEDFNGGHPDPNLTYAHDLVEMVEKNSVDMGAAS
ncbi:Phosphoglucomutase-2, partial [Kappamyces sp. JEL0680]